MTDTRGAVSLGASGVAHVLPCAVCGEPVAVDEDTYRDATRLGAPVQHGFHNAVEAPPLRRFEARVTVVEITDDGEEVLATLTARAEAATFAAATADPLSTALQTDWLRMCQNASLADIG